MVSFAFFSAAEVSSLEPLEVRASIVLEVWKKGCCCGEGCEGTGKTITEPYDLSDPRCVFDVGVISPLVAYCLRVRVEVNGVRSGWSDTAEFVTPEFSACVWKECPAGVGGGVRYSVDESKPRVVRRTGRSYGYCAVPGNMSLSRPTRWCRGASRCLR